VNFVTMHESHGKATVKRRNSGISIYLTPSRKTILEIITKNPKIKIAEIAMTTNLTARNVEKNLYFLKSSGLIKRVGGRKFGEREMIDSP